MFTGLVQHTAAVLDINQQSDCCDMIIASQYNNLAIGESIAVDGVCLTVAKIINEHHFMVQLSKETLDSTHFHHKKISDYVNLERSLCMGDSVGGHWVLGHVDSTILCHNIKSYTECHQMTFAKVPDELMAYIIHKGSVALNGVSLTINKVLENSFEVMIIPHTWSHTNLSLLASGDIVNIEVDYLAKCVINQSQLGKTNKLNEYNKGV